MASASTVTRDRPRIAALVLNSVSHDARVLKEADSLAEAGYEVHIFGILDNRSTEPLTRRASGVTIRRVDLNNALLWRRYRSRSWVALCAASMLVFFSLATWFTPLPSVLNGWSVSIEEMMGMGLLPLVAGIGAFILAARFLIIHRKLHFAASLKRGDTSIPNRAPRTRTGWLQGLGGSVGGFLSIAKAWAQFLKFRVVSQLFCSELDQLMPDAVHCHDLPMLPIGAKWCKANPNALLVFDSHELYEEVSQMSSFMRRVWQSVLRRNAPHVDAFITVNDSIAQEHAKRYPALVPAVVVKNATIVTGEPLVRTRLLRNAAELGDDARVLLYQGGFARHRGLELLIKAAADLPEPWVLVMMGWGNIEGDLKALAARLDPHGRRIRFIPPAPHADLKAWTSGGDLGVIPYENTCLNHWYCSPNKLWEYPIAGVPMLVSPFPELKAVIEAHGVGECLPEHLDGDGLRAVLTGIDDARLATLRDACAEYIANDHWDVYAKKLVAIYAGILPIGEVSDELAGVVTSA